ncbi:glycoside hydrolase family 113 [Mycolicibacterium rutilum]|uniref:glycoside hydrolase family 113 n=1 Tax=Mycolicibacterium rutilum TaxID=370526 RepID=UPI000AF9C3E1|nr:hypothetical protein [Mycolicibacterium rutilum]
MIRALVVVLALVAGCAPAPTPAEPTITTAPVQRGMVLPTWDKHGYTDPSTGEALTKMAAAGANWVQIVPTWYQGTRTASVISPASSTVADDDIRAVVALARGHGLKVLLKPHVDVADGSDRNRIDPADRTAWFSAYRGFITHYAALAAELSVDQLAVGTELRGVSGDRPAWLAVIAGVRQAFSGPLVYAANHDEYRRVAFWDAVDLVGIDAYWSLTTEPTTDVPELRRALDSRRTELAAFAEMTGRRILFTETGFPSQHGAATAPWDGTISRRPAPDEQAAGYEAFLATFTGQAWCAGVFFWTWAVAPRRGGTALDTSIAGKPAQQVVAKWWASSLGARAAG